MSTLVVWSEWNGIPIMGLWAAIASSVDCKPPWVMKSFTLGCSENIVQFYLTVC